MRQPLTRHILFFCIILFSDHLLLAQPKDLSKDTFFLAKKKGLLGRLGKELDRQPNDPMIDDANPFVRFKGKIIRSIDIIPMGLHENPMAAVEDEAKFSNRLADALHRDTRRHVIRKNLFFREGQPLLPLRMTDNSKFLRDQPFIKDAYIMVLNSRYSQDSVDVTVIVWDVFSIGGSLSFSTDYANLEVREENLDGSGNQILFKGLYDSERSPAWGGGAEWLMRNVNGRFYNIIAGFTSFNNSYTNGQKEEVAMYAAVNKPLVSRYTQWTGSATGEFHYSKNDYLDDSTFYSDNKYSYGKLDLWGGYNYGWNTDRINDNEKRIRHFLAGRFFISQFLEKPGKYQDVYNYRFSDEIGLLAAYTIYRQNYRRTNFIYGFGISEDVPSGFNVTGTGGWTRIQQSERMYLGFQANWNSYRKTGSFFSPGIRFDGYYAGKRLEDAGVMVNMNYFSKLLILNDKWLFRGFCSGSFAQQFNTILNGPLNLNSQYGLQGYRRDSLTGSARSTIYFESVFYNLKKIIGFRFAPFGFGSITALTGQDGFSRGYPAVGAGVRTRNENFIFGTIELRGMFFPRPPEGTEKWQVQLRSNLKFRFSSNFVSKPDIISYN